MSSSLKFRAAGLDNLQTPRSLGYSFPAEFAAHASTWLSWPHKEASWPGKIDTIYPAYARFIKEVSAGEIVNINVAGDSMRHFAESHLYKAGVDISRIRFHIHPTNDAWCRDHGPAFLVNQGAAIPKIIVDWGYNAWGNKYPPFDLDDDIPTKVAENLKLPVVYPGIVMEGGSVDFNGDGTVLTTTSCLLNKNRNPHLNHEQIEEYLLEFYGMEQVLWLGDGIVGDDTDGHIDDITRFVNRDTVVTVIEHDRNDENYLLLKENVEALEKMKLRDGSALNIVELPMPAPVVYEGQRLPASYANFYISNACVAVPTFRDTRDDQALEILQKCFPDRKVVGIDSLDVIWGLGSWHCLSQQEPV
ncbi:MAG: agmatine deiminase family protein [Cyclobacteriaceae bacterium]